MVQYHYKGCALYFRLITSAIGVLLGLSAGLSFLVVFKNYHCAGWAFVSGVFALIVLMLHVGVWRDITYSIQPSTFSRLLWVGTVGWIMGVAVFIAYIVKGAMVHESGVQVRGWFIVTVWGYMTWKWGFLLFWYAMKYKKGLLNANTEILSVNKDDDD